MIGGRFSKQPLPPKETFEQRTGTRGHGESLSTDAGHTVREQIHYLGKSARPSGHEKETSFLRRLMLYGHTDDRQGLEEKLTRTERNERCARRAVWLMAVLTGLAVAGLGYSAVLLEEFPQNKTTLVMRIFCALGMASFISLLAFVTFWLVSRGELNVQREKCRRLASRIVESRLGKPASDASPENVRTRSPPRPVAAEAGEAANGENS